MAIGSTGFAIVNDKITIDVKVEAKTEVSTSATPSTALPPLPPLARVAAALGDLAIALPVRVNYDALRTALKAEFAGKVFTASVTGKTAAVTIADIFVYPSRDKIVLGLEFVAQAPGRLFDTKGKVFLTAKPVTENDGSIIRMTEVTFARNLDNALWSSFSVIFEKQIKTLIANKGRIDLSPELARQLADLKAKLSDTKKTGGVRISIRDAKAAGRSDCPGGQEPHNSPPARHRR